MHLALLVSCCIHLATDTGMFDTRYCFRCIQHELLFFLLFVLVLLLSCSLYVYVCMYVSACVYLLHICVSTHLCLCACTCCYTYPIMHHEERERWHLWVPKILLYHHISGSPICQGCRIRSRVSPDSPEQSQKWGL